VAFPAGQAPAAYDPAPFLDALAKPYRGAAVRFGSLKLSELPLYQMDIDLDAVLGTFKAHQEVIFTNPGPGPLDAIAFRTYNNAANMVQSGERNLSVEGASVNGLESRVQSINPTAFQVALPRPLLKGERVRVGLDYRAVLPRLPPGAGTLGAAGIEDMLSQMNAKQSALNYGIYSAAEGVLSLGFFYPILPGRVDGDWDTAEPPGVGDPAHFDPANYLVKLRLPKDLRVACSGIQVGEQPLGPGPESKREVYLVGAALRDFALQLSNRYVIKEASADGIKVRTLLVEDHQDNAQKILGYAVGSLRVYQKLFGPYPYTKLDVAESPLIGGAGGMEYPGLITVAMALLAAPSEKDPMSALLTQALSSLGAPEFTVAHEVAHQWWHVLVGSDSIRHPFLDEALANYSPILYFEAVHGKQAADAQLQMQLAMGYQVFRMMGGKDGAVERASDAFTNQMEYAALVYGKGGLFLHAVRKAIGRGGLLRVLKTYTSRFAFREAVPEDFLKILGQNGDAKRLGELAQRWLYQAHGDEDIGTADLSDLGGLLGQFGTLGAPGFHNFKVDGALDPATLKMLEEAVKQITGP
jgi:hypothetical protein